LTHDNYTHLRHVCVIRKELCWSI